MALTYKIVSALLSKTFLLSAPIKKHFRTPAILATSCLITASCNDIQNTPTSNTNTQNRETILPSQRTALSSRALASAASASNKPAYQLQLNTNYVASWGHEDIFIDYMKLEGYPNDFRFSFIFNDGYWNSKPAREKGLLDPVSGDLLRPPSGMVELHGPLMLPNYEKFPEYYSGDWVFTWEGGGDASIQGNNMTVRSSRTDENGNGRIVFNVPATGSAPNRVRFRKVRSSLKNFKLYRLKNEAQVKAGKLWNPDFINYASDYDIIRTMVSQDINDSPVTRWAHVATPDDPHFIHRGAGLKKEQRPVTGHYGLPYEYLFDLVKETDSSLWMHMPIQIGANKSHADLDANVEAVKANASQNANAILESPAWDEYAVELVKRLKQSGYSKDKALYLELGNEVWNYGWPFAIATKYAEGIGNAQSPARSVRYGYGLLSARMILAMEKALANSGYSITYVIGSQTANPYTTQAAYEGLTDYFRRQGVDPTTLLGKTGIALTTYHGGPTAYQEIVTPRGGETLTQAWERAIEFNPSALKIALHERYTKSNADYSKNWVVNRWREHKAVADQYGVNIIGAYEGGSHDSVPEELSKSEIFSSWWKDYHWGTYGSDVVRQINQAIIDEYPNIILSNFTGIGEVGVWRSPWLDGHYTEETDMDRMWREFGKSARSAP